MANWIFIFGLSRAKVPVMRSWLSRQKDQRYFLETCRVAGQ